MLTGSIWFVIASVFSLVLGPSLPGPSSKTLAPASPAMGPAVYLPHTLKPALPAARPLGGNWLAYVNYYRALAVLPPVDEDQGLSDAAWLHARYMVKNDAGGHSEVPGNRWYTPEGEAAARSSNVFWSSRAGETDEAAIDFWMQAPFHAAGILAPTLVEAGYGSYREQDGGMQTAAAIDVGRGRGRIPASITFPIRWPSDGIEVPLSAYPGGEYPSPLAGCPGYLAPAGLPMILQMGSGDLTPSVTFHSLLEDGAPLDHCLFDETSYENPDSSQQGLGRAILDAHDAVVLVPRKPLVPGAGYTVSVTVNGETYGWSFKVAGRD